MPGSITQLNFQQRFRHAATASRALRPGRYPQEPGWNSGSTAFSSRAAATVCAILSATVGTVTSYCPSLPWRLGIIAFAGTASAWCWFTACQRAPTFESAQ